MEWERVAATQKAEEIELVIQFDYDQESILPDAHSSSSSVELKFMRRSQCISLLSYNKVSHSEVHFLSFMKETLPPHVMVASPFASATAIPFCSALTSSSSPASSAINLRSETWSCEACSSFFLAESGVHE